MKKTVEFFTSLKLTVALLAFAIVLVFVGTLAQADEGLYGAQAHYFKRWFVFSAHLFGHKIPLFLPGGYLIGTLLLVNLVATHIYRFELTWKKAGIQFAHAGIIVLLVGQLATDLLSRELTMSFSEGESRDHSVSSVEFELVFTQDKEVTAIPDRLLVAGADLSSEKTGLPFTIRVKEHWRNSDIVFRAPMMKSGPPVASNGIALNFDFTKDADVKTTDQRNIPTAVLELLTPSGASLGTWVASDWASDPALVEAVRELVAFLHEDAADAVGRDAGAAEQDRLTELDEMGGRRGQHDCLHQLGHAFARGVAAGQHLQRQQQQSSGWHRRYPG